VTDYNVAGEEKPSSLVSTSKDDFFEKLNDWADALQSCVQLLIPSSSGSDSTYTGTYCSAFESSCPVSIFNKTGPGAANFSTSISAPNTTLNGQYDFPALNTVVDQSCNNLDISENVVKSSCNAIGALQCIQGVSQAYQDWYSWVDQSCKSSASGSSPNYTIPPTMVTSTSSRIAVRGVDLVVPLLLSMMHHSIAGS
jgi:hypothetical protein